MEQAARDRVESALGKSRSDTDTPQSDERAAQMVAGAVLDEDDGDEVDTSIDAVYGDTLGSLLPSELRYLLMSWRAAA